MKDTSHPNAIPVRSGSDRYGAVAFLLSLFVLMGALPAGAQSTFDPPEEPAQHQALRVDDAIVLDGRLDESFWRQSEIIDAFVQKEPNAGSTSTFRTEVRIAFDDRALYVAARCEQPRNSLRVQSLERDFIYADNDVFGVAIDGFGDQRSAVAFETTPRGNLRDLQVVDDRNTNSFWDARWDVRTHRADDHWTVEMAIPWRTLRYPEGVDRLGVIFNRNVRHRNELTSSPPVPRAFSVYRMAYESEIVGIEAPSPAVNVQLNPYTLVDQTDRGELESATETEVEAGGEVKWAIRPSTVLDLTYNTDFAQVEADRTVVNLDRFSVFFPEQRQFFLENANLFDASVTNWIRPFFSRRIGLDRGGRPIPLLGGGRLTHRSSKNEVGMIAMQQRSSSTSPASLFGVARYSRNLPGQSRLGGMFTWRRDDAITLGSETRSANDNFTYTLDGLWRPRQSVGLQAMVSMSQDEAFGEGYAAQLWTYYENSWLYAGWLGYFNRDYEPRAGLEILDDNYVMHSPGITLDLRPSLLPSAIRSYNPGFTAYAFQSSEDGSTLFGYVRVRPLVLRFQNGAQIRGVLEPNWQKLEQPFFPAGIEVAPGEYEYNRYLIDAQSDRSAALSGSVSFEDGDYFDGTLRNYSASVRLVPRAELEVTASIDLNEIRGLGVLEEDDDTQVFQVSGRVSFSPRLNIQTLYQRNSVGDREFWNARLAWEYSPLSYVYLVYNRNDRVAASSRSVATSDQLILKVTYLLGI